MANRFLTGLMTLAFCLIFPLTAQAQNDSAPDKKALVKELLRLMMASNNSEAIFNQLLESLREQLMGLASNMLREWVQAQELSPAERKRLDDEVPESARRVANRICAERPRRISIGEIAEIVGYEVYDKHFTETEVKDLIAFYKTATAQKFIRLTPQLTTEMFQRIENPITPVLERLIIDSFADEQKTFKTKRNEAKNYDRNDFIN